MSAKIYTALVALFVGVLCLLTATPVQADLKEVLAKGELRHLGIKYANFVTGSGDGMDVELVQGFAKSLGVNYTLVYTDFDNVLKDLLGKQVVRQGSEVTLEGNYPIRGDMISTGYTILPWRAKVVEFSAPIFPTQVWLMARSDSVLAPIKGSQDLKQDIQDTKSLLQGKSLLVMEKTCLDPGLYGLKDKGLDLRKYTKNTNLNEMVPALLNNDAELSLLDVADALLDMQKWTGKIKVIGPISEVQEMAAAFAKDAPELRNAFDAYLQKIRADGTYDAIVKKYYPGIRSYFPDFFARKS
ncbi:MAG: transporter substrate-binding domain-containing protein [Magnetococcales bacterium]|nr:transporter substrate-binding domain-containing protein [Magnetococcales bacterium]MBF0116695.1 transporter substrate-binding domain-containing protein [Magnetococcales bacterium]